MGLELPDHAYDFEAPAEEPTFAEVCRCDRPLELVDEQGDRRCFRCGKPMSAPEFALPPAA